MMVLSIICPSRWAGAEKEIEGQDWCPGQHYFLVQYLGDLSVFFILFLKGKIK
jgi:hypothetical protein